MLTRRDLTLMGLLWAALLVYVAVHVFGSPEDLPVTSAAWCGGVIVGVVVAVTFGLRISKR